MFQKPPQKTIETSAIEELIPYVITKSGNYLIEKNWAPNTKDSLLNTNIEINLISTNIDRVVFVTLQNDSIQFDLDKIKSPNAIIMFDYKRSPFLSNLRALSNDLVFLFPDINISVDTIIPVSIINENLEDVIEVIEKESIERTVNKYDYILPLDLQYVAVQEIPRNLKPAYDLELTDRSNHYPILNYNQFMELGFDNDFWDNTDYYYTNGIYLSYSHPFFVKSPLSYLLISNGKSGIDYYGITLVQNMYTSLQTKVDSIIAEDRPWAAYSMLGQNLISFDPLNKMKHYSEINFGIVGPYSGGGFIQDLVHTILPNNSPPQGWHNQINTDYIIDYQYKLRSLLYETNKFESYVIAGAQVGTLRGNLKWGFGGKYGNFIPFYKDISIYNRKRMTTSSTRKIRFNFLVEIETQLIGYDATLQGGITDRNSVYVIPSSQVSRFVIEGIGGLVLSYGRFELQFIQHWKSKEFNTGKDHKYVSVRLKTAF